MTLRTELREWTLAAYSVGYCVTFQAAPSEDVPFATVVRCTWRRNGWNSAGEYREMTVVDEMLECIPMASHYFASELGKRLLGLELLDIIERAAGDLDDSRRLGRTGVEFVGGPMDGKVATLAVDAQGFPPEHWILPVLTWLSWQKSHSRQPPSRQPATFAAATTRLAAFGATTSQADRT